MAVDDEEQQTKVVIKRVLLLISAVTSMFTKYALIAYNVKPVNVFPARRIWNCTRNIEIRSVYFSLLLMLPNALQKGVVTTNKNG